ncbi:MAG: hydrogenase iron-sulfur subunit [Candidatus Latescibacterota bacterium]
MKDFSPVIIAFCCTYCAYAAADLAGSLRLQYPSNIRIIRLLCTGRIDPIHIMRALEDGVDGVYVAGCLEGNCHFLTGNFKARKRVQYVKGILGDLGIDPGRVEMFNMSAAQGVRFAEVATQMVEQIEKLGPNPLRMQSDESQSA